MRVYVLDGGRMTDRETAHAYLKEVLGLPDYYGNNLDALYDCLTEPRPGAALILRRAGKVREQLGDYGGKLIATLQDADEENPDLAVTILE